jgi:hypothetical protein
MTGSGHPKAEEAFYRRVVDGVGDRGHHRNERHFADTLVMAAPVISARTFSLK